MSDANALLNAGDLNGARAALVDQVKRAPNDQQARMFLFQLFCLLGEWEKAKSQLRALASLSPEAQMLAVSYNQAIDAEIQREQVFAGQAQPALRKVAIELSDAHLVQQLAELRAVIVQAALQCAHGHPKAIGDAPDRCAP